MNANANQDRYGRTSTVLGRFISAHAKLSAACGILLLILIAWFSYYFVEKVHTPAVSAKVSKFTVIDDHHIAATIRITRKNPQQPSQCIIRTRAHSQEVVDTMTMNIPPSHDHVTTENLDITTTARGLLPEVTRCHSV